MAEDLKHRLLQVAGAAFARRGFDGVSIRDICREAGGSVAAIHYHFRDKRSLYITCLEAAQAEKTHLALLAAHADAPARDRLRLFIHGMLASQSASHKPAWHMELILQEMVRPTDATGVLVERFIRPLALALKEIVEDLCPGISESEHGGWPTGFSIVSQVLFYGTYSPIVRLLMGEDAFQRLSVDAIADHITQFTLAALGKGQLPTVSAAELAAGLAAGLPAGKAS
jgi:AcrR family transcriptional regulator